jgi:predicted amidohydrolase
MISRNLRIALIEDNVAWADKHANLEQLSRNLQNVSDGTDIVVLPELFTTGFMVDDNARELAERNTGDTMRYLRDLSRYYNVAFAGSFLASTASQLYNRAFFIEPNDDEIFYDKRHLFTMSGEQNVYNRGVTDAPIFRFRGMNIKLIVCYDLRFPVFCRNVNNSYDVLLVVANWPKVRLNAWKTLLQARAIENECYVCGVNRCGTDPKGLEYALGGSWIIDYKGKIIGQRGTSPIIEADLSPADLSRFREKFPAWRDADNFSMEI